MDVTLRELRELLASRGHSFVVGKSYLIRTVTMYYVGRLRAITDTDLELESASWIPDTGRFHDCLVKGVFNEVEPFVDVAIVQRGGIVDATEWTHPLPTVQK